MTTTMSQVLVVGAGTSGLALALALKQSRINVRIIDKASHPMVGQRGSEIMPRTLELHGLLGTLPDVLQQGNKQRMMKLYQPLSAEPFKVFNFVEKREVTPSVPYPNSIALWQQHHEGILRDHLKKHGVDVEFLTELIDFKASDDHVAATLLKRSSQGEETTETITVPYLVSTEGAHSVVRKGIPLTFLGETTTQNFVISDIEVLKGLDYDHHHMYGIPGQKAVGVMFNGHAPSRYGYMIFTGSDWDIKKLASGREALIEAFQTFTGRTDVRFGNMMTLSQYTPNIRMVNKFSEGRCFVAGDSAHVHSPTGGQGLNSGIQDSINLGWKLASVIKGQSPPSLLDSYTEERIPIIAAMLNKTRELHYRTVSRNPDDSIWQRGGALSMLGINYRASPIVLDEIHEVDTGILPDLYDSGIEVNAGDRAPEAPELVDLKGETTSLFKIFGYTHHTALVFARDIIAAKPILEGLKTYGDKVKTVVIVPQGSSISTGDIQADYVLEDKAGHAYHAYVDVEKSCTTVVVRPDSYIGAIVNGDGGICKYFEKIYL